MLLLFLSCSHGQDHEWIRQQDKQTWKLETHVRRLRISDRPIAAVQLWKMLFHLRVNRGARSYDLKKIRWRLRFWIVNNFEIIFVFVSKSTRKSSQAKNAKRKEIKVYLNRNVNTEWNWHRAKISFKQWRICRHHCWSLLFIRFHRVGFGIFWSVIKQLMAIQDTSVLFSCLYQLNVYWYWLS